MSQRILQPRREKLNYEISPPLQKIKNTQPHKHNTTKTVKLNSDNGLQTRTTRTPAGNSGFASCGLKYLNSSSVFQLGFRAGLTVLWPEIPYKRKAAKPAITKTECYE